MLYNSICNTFKRAQGHKLKSCQIHNGYNLSQHKRLWSLSHRRPAKAQVSLRIRAVSPEPSLFAHMKNGSRRRVRPNIRHLAPLDGCASSLKNEITEDKKCHNLMSWLNCYNFIKRSAVPLLTLDLP